MESLTYKDSIRLKAIVNMLLIVVLIVYYYTHYIEGTYSFVIPLSATLLWIMQSSSFKTNYSILFNKESVWWIVYFVLGIFMYIAGFSGTNLNFLISRLSHYVIPIMGYFAVKHYNIKEMYTLMTLFGVAFLGNLIQNIVLSFTMPGIFEEMESNDYFINLAIVLNIALTSFIGVCLLFIGCCSMIIDNIKSKMLRLIILLFLLIMTYYITMVNVRGTTILLLGVLVIGLFFAKLESERSKNHLSYYIMSSIVLSLLLFLFVIPILTWMVQNSESARLVERLEDFMDLTKSKGDTANLSEGSLSARIMLAQTSFGTFIANPLNMLIGIGDHTIEYNGDLVKTGIGNHSEFIDVLARHGILGAVIFWNILKRYYRNTIALTKDRGIIKYFNIIFFVFILYGFLNTVFQPIMQIFIFIILPVIIILLDNKKQTYQ